MNQQTNCSIDTPRASLNKSKLGIILVFALFGILFFIFTDIFTSVDCGIGSYDSLTKTCQYDLATIVNCPINTIFDEREMGCIYSSTLTDCDDGIYDLDLGRCVIEIDPEYLCDIGEIIEVDGETKCLVKADVIREGCLIGPDMETCMQDCTDAEIVEECTSKCVCSMQQCMQACVSTKSETECKIECDIPIQEDNGLVQCMQGCIKTKPEQECKIECGATDVEPENQSTVKDIPVYYLWDIDVHNLVVPTDEKIFNNISQCLMRVGQVFKNHNVKVNWAVMESFAEATEKYQSKESNVLRDLEKMGHEIGVHSIGDSQDPSDILINDLGFTPKSSNPAVATRDDFASQLELIQNLFLSRNYKILSDSFSWIGADDNVLIYAWQPSFDPAIGDIFVSDPNNDVIAINRHGGGWAGAKDVDTLTPFEFERLEIFSPLSHFINNVEEGKIIVYPVGVHEDLFTTGTLMQEALTKLEIYKETHIDPVDQRNYWMEICTKTHCDSQGNNCINQCDLRDTSCSDSAIQALDHYLIEVIDPLMAEGKIVSKTYSEIYDIYFDEEN